MNCLISRLLERSLAELVYELRILNERDRYLFFANIARLTCVCAFFVVTSDAACWKAILISLCSNEFSNIPPKLRSHDAAHTTETRSFSKIRLPCHSTLLPTSKRAYCKQ